MRRIRLRPLSISAALTVEAPHSSGVLFPGLRRRNVLHPVAFPQPALIPNVFSPLSALTPAPVRTKTRSFVVKEIVGFAIRSPSHSNFFA